jgi:hypothetical protein
VSTTAILFWLFFVCLGEALVEILVGQKLSLSLVFVYERKFLLNNQRKVSKEEDALFGLHTLVGHDRRRDLSGVDRHRLLHG